ncbi:2OG-Fe(II) oxygenase [Marinomonas epiphytica]
MTYQALVRAQSLALPSREAMLYREPSVQHFWVSNQELLTQAWQEWETQQENNFSNINTSLLDPKLRKAVEMAWQDPSKESHVRDLWEEVVPDVYQAQFFDVERLSELRDYLESVWNANIPLRPPYGIALNRRGAMLDKRSEGYLAAPSFQALYQSLLNDYMRPIARLLFPEIMGYDTQTFGFSINYKPTTDTSLRPHTDASSVTLNININLPDELFTGSAVDFYESRTGHMKSIDFTPGSAMIHRGNVAHAARPITSGERTNLVLWLYGDRGVIPMPGTPREPLDAKIRWQTPAVISDHTAPF